MVSKSNSNCASFKNQRISRIKQKAFALLLINRGAYFGTPCTKPGLNCKRMTNENGIGLSIFISFSESLNSLHKASVYQRNSKISIFQKFF